MQKSESIKELATALAKAQLDIHPATKGSENEAFGNRYADLAATIEACKKPLAENGISVLQIIGGGPLEYSISTMLTHSSGEFIAEELRFTALIGIHATAGLVTYWSRYALRGMLNIPAADDDGNAASGRDKPDHRQQRREVAAEKQKENPPAPIAPASETPPVMMGDSWKRVVCHVGAKTKGRKVEEFGRSTLEYLKSEWKPAGKEPIKDTNLKNAVAAAIAEYSAQWAGDDAKAAQESPATPAETDTPPAPETPVETPPDSEKPAMEWRTVVCTIGNATKGRTLGDIAIQARGNDPKIFDDGPALLRALLIQGVPMLEKKGEKATIQEKILVNAIKAAVAELNPFDNEAWLAERNEDELRNEITRRVVDSGAAPDKLDAAFEEAAAKFSECNEAQLRFILKTWGKIVETAKGAQ